MIVDEVDSPIYFLPFFFFFGLFVDLVADEPDVKGGVGVSSFASGATDIAMLSFALGH